MQVQCASRMGGSAFPKPRTRILLFAKLICTMKKYNIKQTMLVMNSRERNIQNRKIKRKSKSREEEIARIRKGQANAARKK